MLGENDGPSMIAYASDGTQWARVLAYRSSHCCSRWPTSAQEMCGAPVARHPVRRGYGELILQRFGRVWGWFGAGDLMLTNLVTLVAEFVSIRVGLAYFGLGAGVAVALGLALVMFTFSGGRYWRWERIVLGMALFNGLFLLTASSSSQISEPWCAPLTSSHFPGGVSIRCCSFWPPRLVPP